MASYISATLLSGNVQLRNATLFPSLFTAVVVTAFCVDMIPCQFRPMMSDSLLFELMSDGVHHPIREQSKKQVSLARFIFLMIDGTKVEIRFQAAKKLM